MTRQYIGARYVPKFFSDENGDTTWRKNIPYEALTIVTYLGNSYTSKKNVPIGVEITDTKYWVLTGNYNAQITEMTEELHTFLPYLKGKKILVLGDSITAEGDGQRNYITVLREKYSKYGTEFDNYAVSSNTFAGNGTAGCVYMYQNVIPHKDYDIILVAAGINDFFQQYPVGKLDFNDANINTFNGALTYFYKALQHFNIDSEVFFVCPPKTEHEIEHTISADIYRMLIYNACNIYGWHFIDAYAEEPLLSIYGDIHHWTDGTHPNALYTPFLANYIEHRLNNSGGNYLSYAKNIMEITSLCTDVITSLRIYLEFDTHGNGVIHMASSSMISITEAAGKLLFKLPTWLMPSVNMYGTALLNGVYVHGVTITNDGQFVINPNSTANGFLSGSIPVLLGLAPTKNYLT